LDDTSATGHLFKGDSQKNRFYNCLVGLYEDMDESIDLGAAREHLGTHSIRKFADTYASNIPGGPTKDTVKHRAGHSLGRVQDIYDKECSEGDCHCGRTLTLHPMINAAFAQLPCHFTVDGMLEVEAIGWPNLLPNYKEYDVKFKRVLPYLLACLVYHHAKGHLATLLPAEMPIFVQPLFSRGYAERLLPHVVIGIFECPNTGMRATGVSPYIMSMVEINKVHDYLKEQDDREAVFRSDIMTRLGDMAKSVGDEVESRCTLNGQAVSKQVIDDLLKGYFATVDGRLTTLSSRITNGITGEVVPGQVAIVAANGNGFHGWHCWGGAFHPVPETFTMSIYSAKDHWNLWHFGNQAQNIFPHRLISNKRDMCSAKNKTYMTKVRLIMTELMSTVAHKYPLLDCIDESNADAMFTYAYDEMLRRLYPRGISRSCNDVLVTTLYERHQKVKNINH
jgi:hypothetical protein